MRHSVRKPQRFRAHDLVERAVTHHQVVSPNTQMLSPTATLERPDTEETRGHFAAIIESSDDAIISLRLDGTVTSWNPAAERLFGYSGEEMIGQPIARLFPEDRLEEEGEILHHLERGRPISHYETVRRTKDGQLVDISLTISPILDGKGQVVGASKIARDITDRKWAEEFYLRFVSIVNSAMDAIISVNADRQIVLFNLAAQRMFQCSASEAIDGTLDRFIRPQLLRFSEAGSANSGGGHLGEIVGLRGDGSEFPIEASISHATVAGKRIYTVILRDITERKEVEAVVAQLNEDLKWQATQLQSANRELEAFSYSVSHDLRAPLRHVQGYANLLGRELGERMTDKAQRYLQTISDASKDMGDLIDDLLAFSRMGRAQMIETNVDLDELVCQTQRGLETEMRGREIEWVVPSLPEVRADPSMLKLVFSNLLGNAVKYTGKREKARIEIGTAGMEGERLVFFVRDNGAGFDPQYAHKLFGVFQRLHRAEEFEGTGIGLANVQRIIARHGGRVWAEGAVEQGATFYFTLKPTTKGAAS